MTFSSRTSWTSWLSQGTQKLTQAVERLWRGKPLDDAALEALEETLILGDLGPALTQEFSKKIHYVSDGAIAGQMLAQLITEKLKPWSRVWDPSPIVMFVGINGSGKTTVLGKLAHRWHQQGQRLHIIAGDTFRAAADDQLTRWTRGLPLTKGPGRDPSAVIYQGLIEASTHQTDRVLIDTAGRLPNKATLMDELKKSWQIIQRLRPNEKADIVLVLDAGTGQHALTQAQMFAQALPLTGVIMNKMDSSSKGGLLVQIVDTLNIPIYGLGIGEKSQDFVDFDVASFVQAFLGTVDHGG